MKIHVEYTHESGALVLVGQEIADGQLVGPRATCALRLPVQQLVDESGQVVVADKRLEVAQIAIARKLQEKL